MNAFTKMPCLILAVTFLSATYPVSAPAIEPLVRVPRTSPGPSGPIPRVAVDQAVRGRTMPAIYEAQGPIRVSERILSDPRQRARAVGYLAEEDYVRRNPPWRLVGKANAPQNDVYTFVDGRFHGGQIKTHADGNPRTYMRDMLKDNRARHFLVPDDHYAATRREIELRIEEMRRRGNQRGVARWERQLKRLKPMGRTYGELESAVTARSGKIVTRAKALRGGGGYGLTTLVVDGGVVIYRNVNGELTPTQTDYSIAETFVKGASVATATGLTILAGANPIGITVIVVGGVTYFVVDYAIGKTRPHYWTTPLTADQLQAYLPEGWVYNDPTTFKP